MARKARKARKARTQRVKLKPESCYVFVLLSLTSLYCYTFNIEQCNNMSITTLRTFLRRTAPCRLVGSGRLKGFQKQEAGRLVGHKLRGLTKLLEKLHSKGTLPSITRSTNGRRPGGAWRGKNGGRRRGAAVDAQLTSIVNGVRSKSRTQLRLTRATLASLQFAKLKPVIAQRSVLYERHGDIASAADVIAMRGDDELVIVELKTGHDNGRSAAATQRGVSQHMCNPLRRASDCVLHRHMAQLAATHHMFISERETMTRLRELGITRVSGVLLYVNDEAVDYIELTEWWTKKAASVLRAVV